MNEDNQLIETNLLSMAVDAVHKETGLRLINIHQPTMSGKSFDAVLGIEGNDHLRYTSQIKRWAQHANFGALVNEVRQRPGKGMLVADYVNPKMADKLRELNVPFIDAVGNAYINEKLLYIFSKGNKNKSQDKLLSGLATQTMGRAFQPTGLKVVYALIHNPQLVNATYREIANRAGVALGTVGWVINDLKQAGYLIEFAKKQRRLKNKQELLKKWVEAYLEKLRPKMFLGAFTTENEHWWKDVDEGIVDYKARWGGEVAAAKMTGLLQPENITIYLHKDGGNKLLAENHLYKHPKGNIQIYRTFWKEEEPGQDIVTKTEQALGCVDPLIVYADLLATGDPGDLQTARIIYDENLDEFAYG
mgnify:CR=1 FL=1